MKIRPTSDIPGEFLVYCPGCKDHHVIWTKEFHGAAPKWDFNGDMDKPTFSPSLRVRQPWKDEMKVCHSFIRDGNWEFLSDCTHELAGKVVPIEDEL